ncbi:MAG: cytochrome c, partial [Gemmatimonadetes bacterium]|nr:cytochrome c [Gemmatimonadota bacterium]
KARALLATMLPCLGCHELDGDGGAVGPSLTRVGDRRSANYICAIIDDPQGVVPGSAMPRTRMDASTRELVIALLSRGAHGADAAPRAAPAPAVSAVPSGAALYARWCAACHGATGKGDGPNAKRLPVPPRAHANAARMSQRGDDALYDTIAGGGAVMGMSARMPAFGATLSDAELRALVSYLRVLCACAGPAWSRGAP